MAILAEVTPSKALTAMNITNEIGEARDYQRKELTNNDLEVAVIMKENGATWKEIAEQYSIKKGSMFRKVKTYMGDDWENRDW